MHKKSLITSCTLILIFLYGLSIKAEEKLVNLLSSPMVKYTYIDENDNDLGANAFNDKTGKCLVDGKTDNSSVISSPYRFNSKKQIAVLFEFPEAVLFRSAECVWMWGQNEQQWFDSMEIHAGNSKKELRKIVDFPNKRVKKNEVFINIPCPETRSRFVLFKFIQKDDLKSSMFGIGEIRLFGPAKELVKINQPQTGISFVLSRHVPCNIFEYGKDMVIKGVVTTDEPGQGTMETVLTDYFGNIVDVQTKNFTFKSGKNDIALNFAGLESGYYELACTIKFVSAHKKNSEVKQRISVGVAPLVRRSVEDALRSGCRFGIQLGYNSAEGGEAFALLGLQWVRGLPQFGPNIKNNKPETFQRTIDYLRKWGKEFPYYNVFEIKTFPADCYDEKRYGPIAKRKDWFINTVPVKDKYTSYIKEMVGKIPEGQNIFEIWNEPWDGMTPEEFAEIAQITREAIKAVRPNAIIGPNLGPIAHMVKVFNAGGMKDMDMMTIHPYAPDFKSSPERADLRGMIKVYRETLKKYLGKDLALYVTEVGWPTPPQGPMANTEQEQAQYMVRACLCFYAEGIKGIMPYCMGQPETNPNEKEHFFGFIRKDNTPKPVLLAYANMSRQLEGCEYVGDPWLGNDVGAMLFRKNNTNMLVLYSTLKEKKIFLRPGAVNLELTDIMGRKKTLKTSNNRLSLTLTGDPLYLTGVGNELRELIPTSQIERWSDLYKRPVNTAKGFKTAPAIDGDLKDWQNQLPIKIISTNVPENDASAEITVGYDEKNLYLAIRVYDNDPGLNTFDSKHVWNGDSIEIFFSPLPEAAVPGFLKEHDYQMLITPYSVSGKPVMVFGDVYRAGKNIEGCLYSFKKLPDGWQGELAIPLKNFPSAKGIKGQQWALEIALNDLDKKRPRIQLNANRRNDNWANSSVWSILQLD